MASIPKSLLVITGFMGTGKSTVGPLVAEQLAFPFLDTDDMIERRAGKSIPDIFAMKGEAAFRELEADVLMDLCRQSDMVVATGGGALIQANNRERMLRVGVVVCLTASIRVIEARLNALEIAGRPLAVGWRELLAARQEIYNTLPHQVDTNGKSPEIVAEEVVRLWHASK